MMCKKAKLFCELWAMESKEEFTSRKIEENKASAGQFAPTPGIATFDVDTDKPSGVCSELS